MRPAGDPRSDPAEMTGIGASAGDIVASDKRPRPGLRVSKKVGREAFSPAAVDGAVARDFSLATAPPADKGESLAIFEGGAGT
jgi:hypothetical protein